MKLKVAIQMDHVSTIDIDGDSTFVLGLEAERRGYEVWHYTPKDLVFRDRKVMARAQPMKLRREKGNHFSLGAAEMVDLATLDVVLLRQDPPFDMSYITTTHLLEHVRREVLRLIDHQHHALPRGVCAQQVLAEDIDQVLQAPQRGIECEPRLTQTFFGSRNTS